MPDRTRCIHCRRIGFVRVEHVIQGHRAVTDYYCGACEQGWAVSNSDWANEQARADDLGAPGKPGRARS